MTNQLFGSEFCAVRQVTFYPHQDFEQVNFYKKIEFNFIGWSFRNWKIAADSQLAKNWNQFNLSLAKFTFFINIPKLLTMLCKRKVIISSLCVE